MKPAREFSAEALGTFAVTFVSGAALLQARNADAGAGLIDVALAHGLIVFVMVAAFMRLGGNLNPAISLGLLAARRITPVQAGTFIVGQLVGAIVAALSLKAAFPAALWDSARGTRQLVSLDVSTGQAFTLEAIATAIVMFAFMGTVADKRNATLGGLAVGIATTVGFIAIGPLTGGSMNPARTIGPMIATGAYEGLALYVAAPIVGAVIAALVHHQLVTTTDD